MSLGGEGRGSVLGRLCGKDRASVVMDNLFTLNFQAFGEAMKIVIQLLSLSFKSRMGSYMRKRERRKGDRERKRNRVRELGCSLGGVGWVGVSLAMKPCHIFDF